VARIPWIDARALLDDKAPLYAAEVALDDHLAERIRCVGEDGLTDDERHVWHARLLVEGVANNGFARWTGSSASDDWEAGCRALRRMRAEKAARITERAIRLSDRAAALCAKYEDDLCSASRFRRDVAARKLEVLDAHETERFDALRDAFFDEWHS
jgi:hypothetical protein